MAVITSRQHPAVMMKHDPNELRSSLRSLGLAVVPLLGAVALIAGANRASANLTVDCRLVNISGNGTVTDSKHANNVAVGDVLNIQFWAQMTNATGIGNGRFGIQMLEGDILTNGVSTGVTGNATFASLINFDRSGTPTDGFAGFDTGPANGDQSGDQFNGSDFLWNAPKGNPLNDLNGDGSGDIGTFSTVVADQTSFLKVNSYTGAGYQGSPPKAQQTVFLSAPGVVSTTYLNSAYVQGSSWNVINGGPSGKNGVELLIGTFHFTITSVGDGTPVDLNFKQAALIRPSTSTANWYDGVTTVRSGASSSTAFMASGADVVVSSAAPEAATGATLMGGFGLLAFIQRSRRCKYAVRRNPAMQSLQ